MRRTSCGSSASASWASDSQGAGSPAPCTPCWPISVSQLLPTFDHMQARQWRRRQGDSGSRVVDDMLAVDYDRIAGDPGRAADDPCRAVGDEPNTERAVLVHLVRGAGADGDGAAGQDIEDGAVACASGARQAGADVVQLISQVVENLDADVDDHSRRLKAGTHEVGREVTPLDHAWDRPDVASELPVDE